MAQLGESIDTQTTERSRDGFVDVPPGDYMMQIVANDEGAIKNGNGRFLNLRWQVLEGEFENQCVFQWINYIHNNPQAQEIGKGTIAKICDAVGFVGHLTDADVLMHVPCRVTVGWSKAQAGYDKKPEVKSVKPLHGEVAPQQQTQQRQAAVTQAKSAQTTSKSASTPSGGARPWQDRKAG